MDIYLFHCKIKRGSGFGEVLLANKIKLGVVMAGNGNQCFHPPSGSVILLPMIRYLRRKDCMRSLKNYFPAQGLLFHNHSPKEYAFFQMKKDNFWLCSK